MMKRLKAWLGGAEGGELGDRGALVDGAQLRVLMVCTGNICRSPTAEGVMRARLAQARLEGRVWVDSAGTHGYHTGEPPDPRAVRAAAQRGYDLSAQRARPVTPADFTRFHWLLAMDQDHLDWLRRRAPPASTAHIALLMPHAQRHAGVTEVPDPYYGAAAGFERVLDLVEDACDGVLQRVQEHLAASHVMR